MKLIIIDRFGAHKIVESECIPPIGANVNMFYSPMPTITKILMWPDFEIQKKFDAQLKEGKIEAMVFVE